MWQVGVREHRQQASKVLDVVKSGETVEVTEHGDPIALIVPRPLDPRDALVAAGLLTPAKTDRPIRPPTKRLPAGQTTQDLLDESRSERF